MVTTTTTMTNALDPAAAVLRTRAARVARALGFVAVFLITMSAAEHVSRAATSAEGATPAISSSQRHGNSLAAAEGTDATAAPKKSAMQATREAYQQREASSTGVDDFAGGHAGVYIGGSTVVVVLLIVLLIVLI
jgi:hypothetical protein